MSTRPKILLVDDRPENLLALEGLLRDADAAVLRADSGKLALELLIEHEVALAIIDVQMPEMDGFQLAELMRGLERTRQIPIIFVTAGLHGQARIFKGYELGAVDFLVKPIEPRFLASKVRVFLELYHQKAELAARVAELETALAERRSAEDSLVRDHAALRQLHSLSERLVSQDELRPLMQELIDGAVVVTGAAMGTLQLYDEASKSLTIVASHGLEQPFLEHFAVVHDGPAVSGEALRTRHRVVVEDVAESPIFVGKPALSILQTAGVRAVQSTLMLSRDGSLLGVISTHWKHPHRPDEATLHLLDLLARVGADLIEYRQREQALQAANARLREEDRRKSEFMAVLSHELRNPLAPIKNSLYVLDRVAPGGDQARRAQAVIDRQVDQLARLVDDLLDVTRVTRNKVALHREPLNLNDLALHVAEDQRSVFETSGVRLDVQVAPVPLVVEADGARIAQVISNLLQNASKFTGRGGSALLAVEADPGAARAIIRVRDSGVGMRHETLERVFEPFMQADSSLDRSKGGLGLGLALAKGLVELHGGDIRAHSDGLGKGTEMVVRLPLSSAGLPKRNAAVVNDRHGLRVLVIEDNVDSADSLRDALEFAGHEVGVAYNGPEGLAEALAQRPEVVLCDIGLPGMDGYEVARALRASETLAGIPLVALTGYALPDDLERAKRAGFNYHLTKPASLQQLEALLEKIDRAGGAGGFEAFGAGSR